MSMIDRLVVTVGTSLFTSASWRCVPPFDVVPNYRRWSTTADILEDPAARRATSPRTPRNIEEQLRAHPEAARESFDASGPPLRYSAELSTLLRWMGEQGSPGPLGDFLNDSYARVDLIAPSDEADPAHLAAQHLHEVLRDPYGVDRVSVVPELTSPGIEDRVLHFRNYLQRLAEARARVDLVVSGGYKVFAMTASLFASHSELRPRWRLIYVHEGSYNELVVQAGDDHQVHLDIAGRRVMLPPEPI